MRAVMLLTILQPVIKKLLCKYKASPITSPEVQVLKESSSNHSNDGGWIIIGFFILVWIISLASIAILARYWALRKTPLCAQRDKKLNVCRRIYLSTHNLSFCFVTNYGNPSSEAAMLISKLDLIDLNASPAVIATYCDNFIRGEDEKCAEMLPGLMMECPSEKHRITYERLYNWFQLQQKKDTGVV